MADVDAEEHGHVEEHYMVIKEECGCPKCGVCGKRWPCLTARCPHEVWWIYDFALIALSSDHSLGFKSEPSQMRCRDCGLIRDATDEDRLLHG